MDISYHLSVSLLQDKINEFVKKHNPESISLYQEENCVVSFYSNQFSIMVEEYINPSLRSAWWTPGTYTLKAYSVPAGIWSAHLISNETLLGELEIEIYSI